MNKTWDWLKGHQEWIYALACVGLAVWSWSHGDTTGGWVCLGIAVGVVVVIKLLLAATTRIESYDVTSREVELDVVMRAGMEPVPIPGEDGNPPHRLGEDPNCGICRSVWGRK